MLRSQPSRLVSSLPAHDLPLLLPSVICSRSAVPDYALECEWHLREAQAYDTLADIRDQLEVMTYVQAYCDSLSGEDKHRQTSWCINLLVTTITTNITMAVYRYRASFAALTRLGPAFRQMGWQQYLRELQPSDLRYISDVSDGNCAPSWIWQYGCTGQLGLDRRLDVHRNRDLHDGELLILRSCLTADSSCRSVM